MEVILGCCAGLGVHKDSVEACVRRTSAGGKVKFRQIAVDATAWYWHTLGAAWILLLAVLAVGQ